VFGGVFALADLVGDAGGFESPETELAPAADGHGFDEGGFDAGAGLELGFEFGEEVGETAGGFAFNEDGFSEHVMADGIAGGDEFAFGGFGAAGFCAVAAGGLDAEIGVHGGIVRGWEMDCGGFRRNGIDFRGDIFF
jgi:hypothetical protein